MLSIQINPIAFHLGPFPVYWYGLTYVLGFWIAILLARYRVQKPGSILELPEVENLLFYGMLGVVIGGRVGYLVFYDYSVFWTQPWIILKVWQGGMSFHGGLLGVLSVVWLFSWKVKKSFLELVDFVAPLSPPGLAAGRIGNFINGELWGRVSDMPWAMIFSRADALPRHPSQLYEFFLEGVVLFITIWLYSRYPRPSGAVSGLFAVLYAVFRISVEFFREPDSGLGFIAWGWLTMGQLLSIPLLIIGIGLLYRAYCYPSARFPPVPKGGMEDI